MHSDAPNSMKHVVALLPDYLTSTLHPSEHGQVRAHLAQCAACRAELQAWEQIAAATQLATAATFAPTNVTMARVWAAIDAPAGADMTSPESTRLTPWRHRWQVLLRQAQLLQPSVWLVCLIAVIAVTYVASQQAHASNADLVLSAGLPLISAVGIVFLYGHEIDPLLEVALATPTASRWIFFSRWALLFGYNLVLAVGATLVLASLQGQSLWAIIALWLGPMALLATLSALITVVIGPSLAALAALLIWATRFIQIGGDTFTFILAAPPQWQANPLILLLAVAILGLALYVVGRQERFA